MALSPQEVREAEFTTVRRAGYDAAEVDAFQQLVADALQTALDDAAVMEARARAAVARLKKWSEQHQAAPSGAPAPATDAGEAARTLVLAQRTADAAVAEARAEAERALAEARRRAERTVTQARDESARMIDEATEAARQDAQEIKSAADAEVQKLVARRMFLESDVELLDRHIRAQRERITEVVAELEAITNRAVNGLADLRGPQLSASHLTDDPTPPSLGATASSEARANDMLTAAEPAAAEPAAAESAAPSFDAARFDTAEVEAAGADVAGFDTPGDALGDDQQPVDAATAEPSSQPVAGDGTSAGTGHDRSADDSPDGHTGEVLIEAVAADAPGELLVTGDDVPAAPALTSADAAPVDPPPIDHATSDADTADDDIAAADDEPDDEPAAEPDVAGEQLPPLDMTKPLFG